MDIYTLVQQMMSDGTFQRIARNPAAQFGPPNRQYLGAEILPEKTVEENAYREDGIRYRTVIANSGSRYSPSQKKDGGALVGSFLVELGNQDIAREMTGRDYDALVKLLRTSADMDALATVINWVDTVINRALIEETERQRWEAIVNASTTLVGDNEYVETVTYPNPSGHRVAAGGTWSSDAYDPWDDIVAQAQVLQDKGYEVSKIVTSRTVVSILARNAKIAARAGKVVTLSASDLVGRASLADINAALEADGLPPIATYDLLYRTQTTSARFLASTVMVFLAQGGKDETVDWGDNSRYIPGTLGYTAIGRAVGQSDPGRVIRSEAFASKPPRLQAEGWQTTLPVITEPEAIAVITGIA